MNPPFLTLVLSLPLYHRQPPAVRVWERGVFYSPIK